MNGRTMLQWIKNILARKIRLLATGVFFLCLFFAATIYWHGRNIEFRDFEITWQGSLIVAAIVWVVFMRSRKKAGQ